MNVKPTSATGSTAPSTAPASGPALTASALAALLASACCLGPLLLVSLGLGGAWVGNLQVLATFRPLFLAGAGLALLVAGRRIFRRAPACAPGTACSVPATGRASKAVFAIVALLVVLAAVFPYLIRPAQTDPAVAPTTRDLPPHADAAASGRTDPASWRTVTLSVPGMSCHTCPITVRKALLAVHGVTAAEVSLERKTVLVTFDATKTTVGALTRATVDAGYPSSLQGEVTR